MKAFTEQLRRRRTQSPGDRAVYHGHRVLGALLEWPRDPLGVIARATQLGRTAQLRFGWKRAYLITHPEQAQQVLADRVDNYTKESLSYRRMRLLLGDGLLTARGETWLRQRRVAQPAFRRPALARALEVMVSEANAIAEDWSHRDLSRPLDVAYEMTRVTLRVVCRALLSIDIDEQVQTVDRAFGSAMRHLTWMIGRPWAPPLTVPTRRNRRFLGHRSELDQIIFGIIDGRLRGTSESDDLLQRFVASGAAGSALTTARQELRDATMTMFLAGHETTALALTWALYEVARRPGLYQALREESATLTNGPETPEDLDKLRLHRQVIQECLRLYPPLWILGRYAAGPDRLDNFKVSRGDYVLLSIYSIHRNSDVWQAPHRFEPQRFSTENLGSVPRFAFLPFSAGQRKCIGETFALWEAQVVLATLVQRYAFKALQDQVEIRPGITLRPRGGMPMLVSRAA